MRDICFQLGITRKMDHLVHLVGPLPNRIHFLVDHTATSIDPHRGYGTILITNAESSSSGIEFISRAKGRMKEIIVTRRPWKELVDLSAFGKPNNSTDAMFVVASGIDDCVLDCFRWSDSSVLKTQGKGSIGEGKAYLFDRMGREKVSL
ncbi:hypothetical protein Syun_003629 [Stephania yunnanensis]|uniref:Uncharacterized protein n=1 Tax=Stephania yunnanensis TaxID=152371 RepID=A0AAP0Q002_9MAGN